MTIFMSRMNGRMDGMDGRVYIYNAHVCNTLNIYMYKCTCIHVHVYMHVHVHVQQVHVHVHEPNSV